jgi:hypothetical protein
MPLQKLDHRGRSLLPSKKYQGKLPITSQKAEMPNYN